MHFKSFMFVLSLLLGAIMADTQAASVDASAFNAAAVTQICSNQALPAGYVVTSSAVDTYNCPGSNVYRWTISPPTNSTAACFGSGYPAPYFITAITPNGANQCAGFRGSMVLQQPTNNLAVCANGVIWSPWVITSVAQTNGQCANYGVIVIAQASEGLAICSNSPIPSGWTASGGVASSQCQPYLVQTLHRATARTASGVPAGEYIRSGDGAIFTPADGSP